MTKLDLDFVRTQFPAFSEPSLEGQAFFENAGGSYVCKAVIERLNTYYRQTKVQPYHLHPVAQRAGELMDQSYQRLADYLNVSSDDVHLGPSTSQNTYVLAQAFAQWLKPGDELIVTNQDHEANIGVWRRLERGGVVIKEWLVDAQTGELNIEDLDELLTEKTRLLAFGHCSNIVAHLNPVAEICTRAREAGVVTVVDGVSYAGHGYPDVSALGADIYLFSLYKTFGPHQGVMVIRRALAEQLGNQAHYFNEAHKRKWFVPAGPDHAQVAAAQGVLDYFDALHAHHFTDPDASQGKQAELRALLHTSEQALLTPLLEFISHHPRLRLLGPSDAGRRAATVSLLHTEHSPQVVAQQLVDQGIQCGAGHFYAVRLLEAMGVNPDTGVLRLSFVHYTSPDELNQLLGALDKVC
ncbi:MAG: aminotransferase class V-fold PLP-dependent enzyme [Saccharospirillum sp.]|nr:aminotransferase class V-fold PLP-dependent enzyme [Saccharospirillum sp.]